ncbi:MAG TPA: amidohydrolase family protein [Flavobacteriaceae bacterium]|nr:amidohydrolase family protein [Flavobacteriaceae bacterium]
MKILFCLFSIFTLYFVSKPKDTQKVFDVHIHGSNDVVNQLKTLEQVGVYKAALSSSWDLQNNYRDKSKINLLFGLMFPCPNGKVPYSLQSCYENGQEWPSLNWVEQQIKESKIDFLGEILNEYYGISPSDSLLFPYYALAEKYNLPVGIHTGGAGPNHGSPNFKIEMGNPLLLEKMLIRFSQLKVWIMHSGGQYYKETIDVMHRYDHVYADISVISNPDIVPSAQFKIIMKAFLEAGLEDRIMFGSDNGDIEKVIASLNELDFLTKEQKDKIFYKNAERFFATTKKAK